MKVKIQLVVGGTVTAEVGDNTLIDLRAGQWIECTDPATKRKYRLNTTHVVQMEKEDK